MVARTALRTAADLLAEPILPGPGHNAAPAADALADTLAARYGPLVARRDQLLAAVGRAPAIENDDADEKAADFLAKVATCVKAAREAHKAEKQPFLDAGRTVDRFFLEGFERTLVAAVAPLERACIAFKGLKDARLRREAEAEAERQRQQAEIVAAEARTDADLDQAIAHEQQAQQAAAVVYAKPAELTRARAGTGAMTSLKEHWDFRVSDLSLVPRAYLTIDPQAVRRAIANGTRKIDGLEIFPDPKLTKRR